MQRNGPIVLKQHKARPHTTRITRARLAAANVNTTQWPAMSPDMNPIEYISDVLSRNVRRYHAPQNILQTDKYIESGIEQSSKKPCLTFR
jgi:transposase